MTLTVELDDEMDARRAIAELEAAGFDQAELEHPYDGGRLISVDAWGWRLVEAFEILRRYESRLRETQAAQAP